MRNLSPVFLCFLFLLCGCGTMFDISGKGSKDRKIYYDVGSGQIISTYNTPVSSIFFSKSKHDSIIKLERIVFDTATTSFRLPVIQDSIAFYDFQVSLHLQDDHWRMMYHITITKKLTETKTKVYARFTSH